MSVRARSRQRRGYTLAEVTIVAGLTSAMLILLLRWVLGLGAVVGANLATAETGTLARASEQLAVDVMTVAHCQDNGSDARVKQIAPTRLALVTQSGPAVTSVVWRIQGGVLQRGEAEMSSDCAFIEPTSWTTWTRNVDEGASGFSSVQTGLADVVGTDGVCENEYVARCQVDAVDARLKNTADALEIHKVIPVG